jgi:hypothetical protein
MVLGAAAAALIFSLGCTDGSPTAPPASAAPSASEGFQATRPSRPPTRVLPPRNPLGNALRPGSWGSAQSTGLDNRLLIVTGAGASFRSECANGTIETTIRVDADGRFEAAGTYQNLAGPIGEAVPARFLGVAVGESMALTIESADGGSVYGPFLLTFGQAPVIGACPIV